MCHKKLRLPKMPSVKTAFPLQDKFWLPGGAEGSDTYAV